MSPSRSPLFFPPKVRRATPLFHPSRGCFFAQHTFRSSLSAHGTVSQPRRCSCCCSHPFFSIFRRVFGNRLSPWCPLYIFRRAPLFLLFFPFSPTFPPAYPWFALLLPLRGSLHDEHLAPTRPERREVLCKIFPPLCSLCLAFRFSSTSGRSDCLFPPTRSHARRESRTASAFHL